MLRTLRLIAWRGYDDAEAAAPLLARDDVKVEVVYVDSDPDTLDLLRFHRHRFDAVAVDNRYLPWMVEDGLVEPIEEARIGALPALLDTFVRRCRDGRGTRWAVPYIWGRQPIPYRGDLVSETPTSWLDVLRPELHRAVDDRAVDRAERGQDRSSSACKRT